MFSFSARMEEKRKREAEKRNYEEEQVFCTVLRIFQVIDQQRTITENAIIVVKFNIVVG